MQRKQFIKVLAVITAILAIAILWNKERKIIPHKTSQKEEENTNLKMDTVKMVMVATGCSEKNAERILEQLKKLPIEEITLAVRLEGADDHSILVTDSSGKTYELGIDKTDLLYSVRDMDKDKYLLTVYE